MLFDFNESGGLEGFYRRKIAYKEPFLCLLVLSIRILLITLRLDFLLSLFLSPLIVDNNLTNIPLF
jgi:hypothetical protein